MRLETMRVPPVSKEFYDRLVLAFPPIDPRNIRPDTTMIEIQRNAAQQEMILFIQANVRKEYGEPQIEIKQQPTMWQRIKALLFNK